MGGLRHWLMRAGRARGWGMQGSALPGRVLPTHHTQFQVLGSVGNRLGEMRLEGN